MVMSYEMCEIFSSQTRKKEKNSKQKFIPRWSPGDLSGVPEMVAEDLTLSHLRRDPLRRRQGSVLRIENEDAQRK
jgi:hypothetical protein